MSPSTAIEEFCTVRPAVASLTARDGRVVLMAWPRTEYLGALTPAQRDVLRLLAEEPRRLVDLSADDDVRELVRTLGRNGWLSTTLYWEGRPLYTIAPFGAPPERPTSISNTPVLSKFTIMRRHHGDLVLENPRSWCDIRVHAHPILAMVSGLLTPSSTEYPPVVVERVLADLQWSGCLIPGPEVENERLAERQWSAHELWFHHRTRLTDRGWTWEGYAGTDWAKGIFAPLPARHDPYPSEPIALFVPDLDCLRETDIPLTVAIEDRYSCRYFDDAKPMTVDQLAELLYRCVRTRRVIEAEGREIQSRPYPSGGSMYELEFYPVVRRVDGLESAMYHYDTVDHVLRKVADVDSPAVKRLLFAASRTQVDEQEPQVLIVIAARVGRLMWRYEQIPYSLILKHVGTCTQTLYLVATAMGLGAVALGAGDSVAFTEATGTDDLEECSVGDFVVGSSSPRGRELANRYPRPNAPTAPVDRSS
ncbi:SagB family peptide dehydrogenase [Nocardia sp. NPDC059195]|uniref:SagB family peptide dehydrogenase n=1 Tax=Nocardia sp. NPDC059195 TaxID=3346765 RepID=UPI0036B5C1D4